MSKNQQEQRPTQENTDGDRRARLVHQVMPNAELEMHHLVGGSGPRGWPVWLCGVVPVVMCQRT